MASFSESRDPVVEILAALTRPVSFDLGHGEAHRWRYWMELLMADGQRECSGLTSWLRELTVVYSDFLLVLLE